MNDQSPTGVQTTATDSTPNRTLRRWFAAGMFSLALGALLVSGTAFAQSDTDDTSLHQTFLDRLAEKLGISSGELEATIQETQNDVIDDAVANGRLTEQQGERAQGTDRLRRRRRPVHARSAHGLPATRSASSTSTSKHLPPNSG